MTSKERVLTTFEFREPDRVPSWLGASPEFIINAIDKLKLKDEEELRQFFGVDIMVSSLTKIAEYKKLHAETLPEHEVMQKWWELTGTCHLN